MHDDMQLLVSSRQWPLGFCAMPCRHTRAKIAVGRLAGAHGMATSEPLRGAAPQPRVDEKTQALTNFLVSLDNT